MSSDTESSSSCLSSQALTQGGGTTADLIPPTIQLSESAVGKTSKLFTKSQRAYLNSLKTQYIQCPKALKPEHSLRAAEYMLDRMEKKGLKKSRGEKAAFRAHVRRWFQQNCRVQKDLPRWASQWTGRLVFYHKNPKPVNAEWKRLCRAAGEIIPEVDEADFNPSSEDEDDSEVQDESDATDGGEGPSDEEAIDAADPRVVKMEAEVGVVPKPDVMKAKSSGNTPNRRAAPPVRYFQQALSNVYSQLPSLIRKEYEKTAIQWRTNGPDDSIKRKLADKDLPRISRHFAETVYRQMNVRVAMFVTYVGERDGTVISFLDYTNDFGNRSFTNDFGTEFEKSGIMGHWGAYGRSEFENAGETDQPKSEQIRKRGKPLLSLQLNEYGEPIIPDPTDTPPGEQPNEYLKRLIRNVVIYTYARACGREPKDVGPPWGKMKENIRNFINPQYLPDNLASLFQEPTGIKVKPAREILGFWYKRQTQGLIPLAIHNYVDDEGDLVPSLPRERIEMADDDPDYEDDGVIVKVPELVSGKARRKSGVGVEKKTTLKGKKGTKKQKEAVASQVNESENLPPSHPAGKADLVVPDAEDIGIGKSADGVEADHSTPNRTSDKEARKSKPPRPRPKIRLVVNSDSETDTRSLGRQDSPALPPPSSPTPALSPAPTDVSVPHSSTPTPSLSLEALNTDPDVASLAEPLRALVLDVVRRHLGTSSANPDEQPTPAASILPPSPIGVTTPHSQRSEHSTSSPPTLPHIQSTSAHTFLPSAVRVGPPHDSQQADHSKSTPPSLPHIGSTTAPTFPPSAVRVGPSHDSQRSGHSTSISPTPPHIESTTAIQLLEVPGPSTSTLTPTPARRQRRTEEEVLLEAAAKAGAKSGKRVRKTRNTT